ncbi:MAG TPA: SpoIVB peptidase [Caproiciproducens sp.]|nr:SpoIVB peptidase [Caproiciproducens sp.]
MRKVMKAITMTSAVLMSFLMISIGLASYFTPDSFQVAAGKNLEWNMAAITVTNGGDRISLKNQKRSYTAQLMLCNIVPIKTVNVDVISDTMLIPCGTPFGIKMFTNGVVVVGVADIQTAEGNVNPADASNLKVGDVITAVNGNTVNTNAQIADLVQKGGGKKMKLVVRRDNLIFSTELQPVKSEVDGTFKAGLWVRDSTAGIGTLTFYNPNTRCFGGLGHGVCDTDTNELMPLLNGEIVPVTINGITKGQKGTPGELRGYFSTDNAMGNLQANLASGVYGTLNHVPTGKALEVGMKQDVKNGPAKILTTIDDKGSQYYDIEIEKIDYRENLDSKNMVIHITDPKLLAATGGIVQGMSGSPILQNGKLVGAVTHVFVNDPTRGYGIFAENMLAVSQNTKSYLNKKAS